MCKVAHCSTIDSFVKYVLNIDQSLGTFTFDYIRHQSSDSILTQLLVKQSAVMMRVSMVQAFIIHIFPMIFF